MRVLLFICLLLAYRATSHFSKPEEKNGGVKEEMEETQDKQRDIRDAAEIIVTEDESVLSPKQLDAQDEPLRSVLHNGPISQTITELGGRPILSQAFDLGKASANEPYRIVRRERLRLPTYVHDVVGGVTPQPLPPPPPPPSYYPSTAYGYPSYGSPYPGYPPYPYVFPQIPQGYNPYYPYPAPAAPVSQSFPFSS